MQTQKRPASEKTVRVAFDSKCHANTETAEYQATCRPRRPSSIAFDSNFWVLADDGTKHKNGRIASHELSQKTVTLAFDSKFGALADECVKHKKQLNAEPQAVPTTVREGASAGIAKRNQFKVCLFVSISF